MMREFTTIIIFTNTHELTETISRNSVRQPFRRIKKLNLNEN